MTAGTNVTEGLPVFPSVRGLMQSPVSRHRGVVMTSVAIMAVLLVYGATSIIFEAILCTMLPPEYHLCVCQAPPSVMLNRDTLALAGMRGR